MKKILGIMTIMFLFGSVVDAKLVCTMYDQVEIDTRMSRVKMYQKMIQKELDIINTLTPQYCMEVYTCGDGVVERYEQCDDGNAIAGDGCNNCYREYCGDGIVNNGEVCDDKLNKGCVACSYPMSSLPKTGGKK